MIGDMSKAEIQLATRIHVVASMKDINAWHDGLEFYVKFLLSRDRKSRKEIIDAIKGQQMQKQGLMSRMNPVICRSCSTP